MFKKCGDSIKLVAALAKIQNTMESSHHLTLMENCKTFYEHVFFCVRVIRMLLWLNSKVEGSVLLPSLMGL